MSSGPILTGNEEHTTFRDLERMKWARMRQHCPCYDDKYCSATDARCHKENCPFHYWANYRC
jgi:hypothetical protein